MNNVGHRFPVLERARSIARDDELDILDLRKHLGVPLANDMRQWLSEQPPQKLLLLDFSGIRAITLSVAEEIGPLLMQDVAQRNSLEQRYPAFRVKSPEPAYTLARAFANLGLTAVGIVDGAVEPTNSMTTIIEDGNECASIVILGQISKQMEQIVRFADAREQMDAQLTSDDLVDLDFLEGVSPAARSKRLTELYSRRLLAFVENPRNPRERLFTPAWRLPTQ